MERACKKLPRSWLRTTLGDVYQVIGGGTPSTNNPNYWDGKTPWITSADIEGVRQINVRKYVTEKGIAESTTNKVPAKTLLVVTRVGLGKIAIADAPVCFSQDLQGLIQNPQLIFPEYALYLLSYELQFLKFAGQGTTISGVTKKQLKDLGFPLPPLPEQHRIVAKIEELFSELDKGVESLKTAREQLKAYRQALLKHAFEGKLTAQWRAENRDRLETADALQQRIASERAERHRQQLADWEAGGKQGSKPKAPKPLLPLTGEELAELPELPKGWGWVRLGEFIDAIDAGKSFKCDEREPRQGEIGVAKVSAVTWGVYDETESKTCTDSSKEISAYMIRAGDFILSRANTIDLVGACVIAKQVTKKIMLSDKTLRIRFEGFSQDYFLQYLRCRTGRRQIMKLSTGNQESMRNIGQERICSIAVPICTAREAEAVLEELEAKLSEADHLDQTLANALQQSEALRQSILKKAFSGQLVPQDANDEPAAHLLERIRAERSAVSGKTTSLAKAGATR